MRGFLLVFFLSTLSLYATRSFVRAGQHHAVGNLLCALAWTCQGEAPPLSQQVFLDTAFSTCLHLAHELSLNTAASNLWEPCSQKRQSLDLVFCPRSTKLPEELAFSSAQTACSPHHGNFPQQNKMQ